MTDPAEARAREIADNWYEAELDRDNGTTITVGAGLRLCEAIAVALRSRPSHAESYRAGLEAAAKYHDEMGHIYKLAIEAGTFPKDHPRTTMMLPSAVVEHETSARAIRALPIPEAQGVELETTDRKRFWFDTEFYEDGERINLISIGIVAEDGREYYAETDHAHQLASVNDWLRANVYPHLSDGSACRPRKQIADEIVAFCGDCPEFWAYYADYDWVVLCQLFGRMIDLPKGWPMYCRDIKQIADQYGVRLPKQEGAEHNALADARWNKLAFDRLLASHKE